MQISRPLDHGDPPWQPMLCLSIDRANRTRDSWPVGIKGEWPSTQMDGACLGCLRANNTQPAGPRQLLVIDTLSRCERRHTIIEALPTDRLSLRRTLQPCLLPGRLCCEKGPEAALTHG